MHIDKTERRRLLQSLHQEMEQEAYQVQREGQALVVTGVKPS